MKSSLSLYLEARKKYPSLAQKADREYFKDWGQLPSTDDSYSWFHSVAIALNEEMKRGAYLSECGEFFDFVARALNTASDEVKQCIDVSFVENLFWGVPPAKAAAYWHQLPPILKTLYVGFHSAPPL